MDASCACLFVRSTRCVRRLRAYSHPMEERRHRCARCGKEFAESEQGDSACSYHPGRFLDYDQLGQPGCGAAGDFWDCCMRQVQRDIGPEDLPGCATGRHEIAAPDAPLPWRRGLVRKEKALRRVMGKEPDSS